MQLAILTAVLAALAASEASEEPVGGVPWRLAVVAIAALLAPLTALVGTQRLAGSILADARSDDGISRLQAVVIGLWLAAVATTLFVAEWPQVVRGNWQLAKWPLVDELAILLPIVAPLVLVWAALYRLDRAMEAAVCRARQRVLPPPRLAAFVWLQVRQHLGLVLVPPLVIVAILETLARLHVTAGDVDGAWWLVLPLLATMLVLMPLAVRRIWRTTPLAPGPLRDMLTGLCVTRRCHVREMLIWHTGGTLANAAVVGLSRWLRYLLLTDVLVKRLSDVEIAAVVRHELAHLRRWHLPLRLLLLVLPLSVWASVQQAWPELDAAIAGRVAASGIAMKAGASFGMPVAMLSYAVIVVGWYSRLLEHDADLEACLNGDGKFDGELADDFCRALVTLFGRSRESRLGEWLHPPQRQRLAVIRRAEEEPKFLERFRWRAWWLAAAIAAGHVAALATLVGQSWFSA